MESPQPKMKFVDIPKTRARSRSGVKTDPMRKGKFIRVNPNAWDPAQKRGEQHRSKEPPEERVHHIH